MNVQFSSEYNVNPGPSKGNVSVRLSIGVNWFWRQKEFYYFQIMCLKLLRDLAGNKRMSTVPITLLLNKYFVISL